MHRYSSCDGKKEEDQSDHKVQNDSMTHQSRIPKLFPSKLGNYEDESDEDTNISVYLHHPPKKSVKIELNAKTSIQEVKKIVQQKIGVRKDKQLLYLNGKNVTEYGSIRFRHLNIIHILSTDQLCRENQEIQVKVTFINFYRESKEKIKKEYKISASDSVGQFVAKLEVEIKGELEIGRDNTQFYLLESSRLLQKNKSFADQDVTKFSQIVCVITENQIKTRFSNDTKEQIIHDIEELLGIEGPHQNKNVEEKQKMERPPRFLPPIQRQMQRSPTLNSQRYEDEDPYQLKATRSQNTSAPNFKKKTNPVVKQLSFDQSPTKGMATKLRASKSKKDIQILLHSQEKQHTFFEASPEIIKEVSKEEREDEEMQEQMEMKLASPQIPKAMPVNQRRKIRMEIQKLFDIGGNETPLRSTADSPEQKEQKKPISPATEALKTSDRMRLSMGSRPAFLEQLRFPASKESKE